jgi:hypothetical protein
MALGQILHTQARSSQTEDASAFSRNLHRLSLKSTHRLRPSILEWHEVSCRGRMERIVQNMHGALPEVGWFMLRWSGRMEEAPPPWLISAVLFAWAWVDTCHP